MKKVLSALLAVLLMLTGTGFAGKGEGDMQAQEIDLSVLLSMPGFIMEYSEDNKPQWFAYENQHNLVDEAGCYVIPCITTLETGIGDFMVMQLDVGHYTAPDSAIEMTGFSVLVDETQYTFSKPHIWTGGMEEYGMILCGQDSLAMLEGISAATSPVYIVLTGNKGSFAYEMTEVQQRIIKSLFEGGEKAGLFSNEMVLGFAQSYTSAEISAISPESKEAVAETVSRQNASTESMGASSPEGPAVDFSVFDNLPGFTAIADESTGHFAVYYTDSSRLYTNADTLIEPLIGSIMGASGYAPLFFLSLAADSPAEFIIYEAALIVDGNRYTFSPSQANNLELSSVFRISCGQTAQEMLDRIMQTSEPVVIELAGESETISFPMTAAQMDALQTLYSAYLASGAAAHEPTLDVAEALSPVAVKVNFTSVLPAPATAAATEHDLPVDITPFENLPGIVMEEDASFGLYRFVYSSPVPLMDDELCLLDPYVASDIDEKTGETSLHFILAATKYKTAAEKLNPARLRFLVDGMQYEVSGSDAFDTDALTSVAVLCGTNALEMIKKIIASPEPVEATIVCREKNIDFTLTEKQLEVLKSLYDAYMLTSFAKDEALLDRLDAENPVTITDASASGQAPAGPVIELDNGDILEDKSFIIHTAEDGNEHYTENHCFLEPVFVYDAEMANPDLFYALAVGQDPSAAPPDRVTITVDGNAYAYEIELSKGFLHLTYALIPCGHDELAMIDALLHTDTPATVTITTKNENVEFAVTEKQKELLRMLHEEQPGAS